MKEFTFLIARMAPLCCLVNVIGRAVSSSSESKEKITSKHFKENLILSN